VPARQAVAALGPECAGVVDMQCADDGLLLQPLARVSIERARTDEPTRPDVAGPPSARARYSPGDVRCTWCRCHSARSSTSRSTRASTLGRGIGAVLVVMCRSFRESGAAPVAGASSLVLCAPGTAMATGGWQKRWQKRRRGITSLWR
jgi:hypothetical protein